MLTAALSRSDLITDLHHKCTNINYSKDRIQNKIEVGQECRCIIHDYPNGIGND